MLSCQRRKADSSHVRTGRTGEAVPSATLEPRPTVVIIDDDASVREAIRSLVRSVGLQAQTFESAYDFLRHGPPAGTSCLVLDVRLPGLSGLDFQEELTRAHIEIPIIFITGHGDIPMTVRAMKAGAAEFLTKPFRDQDLLDAVQHALERDRATRPRASEIAALQQRFSTLTERERQVMRLVVAGRLNKEIAAELGTAEITVKVQRGHMMRKMQAESVTDLVRMAERIAVNPLDVVDRYPAV
jgi:FixJ family two-component response regulator